MRRAVRVAVLVSCASALGCGRGGLEGAPVSGSPAGRGDAGVSDATDPSAPLPPAPVAGYWQMYGFEDPVAVLLAVGPDGRDYDVTGRGCNDFWHGLFDAASDDYGDCGELHGHGAGLALDFSFYSRHWKATYWLHTQASKDGRRMEGTVWVQPDGFAPGVGREVYGWFRLEDIGVRGELDQPKWPPGDMGPFPDTGNFSFSLALQGDAAVGALLPGQTYFERLDTWGPVRFSGDLGAFWNPDLHWDEATRTYTAGPIPETLPGVPVKLEFHLDAADLGVRDVVATTADGATGTLLPVNP
jgi:hypothetical protein